MGGPVQNLSSGAILPAPACDLLDRFTTELGIPLTLTDLHGAVVASTDGALAGHVEPTAAALAETGTLFAAGAPLVERDGRVFLGVALSGRPAGVLVVHADGQGAAAAAPVIAVALGLALDFAEAASSLGSDRVDPGWLLHGLLRGSREEAQRARVVSSIYGWNLFVQRVALVVQVPAADLRRHEGVGTEEPTAILRRALGAEGRSAPLGQVDETEWVVLARHEPGEPWGRVRQAAERIHDALSAAGIRATVGIGEPHLPANRVAALRRSYREAVYAARFGPGLRGGPGVFELRTLGPAAFFAPSGPSRRNLAALVLSPLAAQPAVVETLRTYLGADMSVADTAARLGLHRHTVRNHLERVFSLTGLDPRTLEGAVQLRLALLVASSDPEVMESLTAPTS